MIFVATKKDRTTNFFHSSLFLLFLDRAVPFPRSGLWDGQKSGSGILDTHSGSATLIDSVLKLPGKKYIVGQHML